MFTELMRLAQSTPMLLHIEASGDRLKVTLAPTPKASEKPPLPGAMTKPLVLRGTPEELDAEFAGLIKRFTDSYTSMKDSVDAAIAISQAAEQEARERATAAVKAKGRVSAKPATTNKAGASADGALDEGDDSDDDCGGDGGNAGAVATPTTPSTQPAPSDQVPSLF